MFFNINVQIFFFELTAVLEKNFIEKNILMWEKNCFCMQKKN